VYVETTLVDDDLLAGPERSAGEGGRASTVNLLYLSRLESGKGLIETIEAFALLREMNRAVTLTVVGEGSQRPVAETLVSQRQIAGIRFLGHIEGAAKAEAFSGADVYVLPTYYAEGMPTSVLEAMAYGLPIVTRPVGGLKDFFEDGRMGCWTESRDPAALALILDQLVSDPVRRRQMGDYNRAYARERFAASKLAARLEALYERTLSRVRHREHSTGLD
jgi:glycosyltransferase involved in cell wall biosynthesis